ncbi:cilia- and flagella-associated protein 45 isoform X2 [Larimichthys crocea]|uniref:cilia- and flagella-associated protein 45 isoform X2 n=1 Tax=Larimichthys crocea TaxID=215358 RepID=UPI000F5D7EB8|nr:cilia- and flagella-associated protein 45 isoform X2 [Larimichthys crocea]
MGRGSKTSRGSSFRYRTISSTSDVDETLFGSPTQVSSHLDKCGKSKAKKQQKETQKNQDGETIQIVTKDLIRTLRIPKESPSGDSIIIPSTEFERITSNSQILTKEEREAQKATREKKKEEEHKKAEEMKRRMMELDMSRKQNPLSEEEVEARETQNRLVERANQLQLEEDEEIRTFNQLILNAKCRAICDAQMQEKKLCQAEYLKEEKRLDAMMEAVRRKALENEAEICELRKQQRISKMQEIRDQIQKHLDDEIIQNEMKEQEKQQIRENQEKMDLEDLKYLEKKKEAQQRLHEEVMRINEETSRAKEQRMEEEKLADMKDMEYNRKKMEKEAEYEAEQRRIKKEKDLEIARLRAQHEKTKDRKAEEDELHARRHQESTNREWRRKELELAEKKAQEEAKLKVARLEQVQYKERFLSMEAAGRRQSLRGC